ncbi:MAG: ThiF family adenylyltransferase [Planctomycetota bacterium]
MQNLERYSRQMRVGVVGASGQQALRRASVLIVGCGALGTHLAEGLTRAGVGRLDLVDRDIVEWSNLQRQVLFTEGDAREGLPKAVAARDRLREINADVELHAHVANCSPAFLDELSVRPDLVLDGTDNFPTRYLINDWCRKRDLPWIYAGAVGTEGAAMVVRSDGPCLRCLWPEAPHQADVGSCETSGILMPAIGAVTSFQLAEAFKLLVGAETSRGVFTCDVWRGQYALVPAGQGPASDCAVCAHGEHPALQQTAEHAVSMCGRDAVQIEPPAATNPGGPATTIDLDQLATGLAGSVQALQRTPHLLRFEVDGVRFTVFPGGRALLFGVTDPLRGRALYDRWLL